MSSPFRITQRKPGLGIAPGGPEQGFKDYLDRLLKMVPGEVIGLYLVGSGLIPKEQTAALVVWSILCAAGVVVVRAFGTANPSQKQGPVWIQVVISTIAFVIWLYSMGGPFVTFGIHVPFIGSLLVLAWSFFVPFFYHGVEE
jgi:hypothetical protein